MTDKHVHRWKRKNDDWVQCYAGDCHAYELASNVGLSAIDHTLEDDNRTRFGGTRRIERVSPF